MGNRAQRRALGLPKEPTYTLTKSQIDNIKKVATDAALDAAFIQMIGLPVLVLHDNFNKLMRREVDGKTREARFVELLLDLQESVNGGFIEYSDILDCIKEECNIDISERLKNRRVC